MWKKCIKQTSENTSLLAVKDHRFPRATANSYLRCFNYKIINV